MEGQDIPGVVVIISVNGSTSFFAKRGSNGTNDPNNFTTLINTQLLLEAIYKINPLL
jgi:hypothetical protein